MQYFNTKIPIILDIIRIIGSNEPASVFQKAVNDRIYGKYSIGKNWQK